MSVVSDPVKTVITYVAVGTALFLASVLVLASFDLQKAKKREAQAVAALNLHKAEGAVAAVKQSEQARAKEQDAQKNQDEVIYELNKKLEDRDGRVADLLRRVRLAERDGVRGSGHTKATSTPKGSHGESNTGLRSLDGGDLVLTPSAQTKFAEFAVSARETGETLKACRKLMLGAEELTSD